MRVERSAIMGRIEPMTLMGGGLMRGYCRGRNLLHIALSFALCFSFLPERARADCPYSCANEQEAVAWLYANFYDYCPAAVVPCQPGTGNGIAWIFGCHHDGSNAPCVINVFWDTSECKSGATQSCNTTGTSGYPCTGTQGCSLGKWGTCKPDSSCQQCVDGKTRSCYNGSAGTQGVGPCRAGQQTCISGSWGAICQGEVLPQSEICDGIDNNCDGQIDEGFECKLDDTKSCYDGLQGTEGVGICHAGTKICSNCQWAIICWNQVLPDYTAATCDGIDHKCNNSKDDGCDQCDDDTSQASAAASVRLYSGGGTASQTDLTIGTVYPISIQRQYHSSSAYDSPLGYGWALNYDKRIYTYPDGSVTLRRDCGKKQWFTWSVAGFIPPQGEYGSLVQNVDNTYTYTAKDGSKEHYDIYGRLAGLVDAKGNSVVLSYMADYRSPLTGLLFTNLNLIPLTVSYDYRLSKVEEKDATGNLTGASMTLSYDTSTGRLNGLWDSSGRAVSFTHDGFGNLTGVNGPSGSFTYGYNDPNNMHRVTSIDEGKEPYINTYDKNSGRIVKQTHGAGETTIDYLVPGQKHKVTTVVKDAEGNVLNTRIQIVEYGARGRVIKNTDTFGNVTNYIRDPQTADINREEFWENTGSVDTPNLLLRTATDYTYDQYGNMKTKTEASNPASSDWDAIKRTTTYIYVYETDPSATAATFHKWASEIVQSVVDPSQYRYTNYEYYNATGNLKTMTENGLLGDGTPYSYTTTNTYDAMGRIAGVDGPRTDVQDVTTYLYDPLTGNRNGVVQPLIGTTTYTDFDSLGNPRTVTDANGNSTTYTYDTAGRVLTVKAPGDAAATQYVYVNGGCTSCGGSSKIDHITLPEGNTIWYTYDTMGNVSAIKDNANNTINYTYDSEGNKLTEQIKDSAGTLQKSLGYEYDALNRLAKIKNPDQTYTQYEYDSRRNRKSVKAPARTVDDKTSYSYDALNRLVAVIQPGSFTTSYAYDTNNNLTSVTDAVSHTTTYRYDDKGRVYQVISPDTGTTTYSYDPAGDMISKADAKGVTISYVYDALNRLTKIDFPTDTDIVYVYDNCMNGKGRLCSMTDASGATVYDYTAKAQVKNETKTIDSIQYVTQYTYDQNGNLKTMTYPSGRMITYNLTNDKVISVLNNAASLATNINYKPFGGMSSLTYGNGIAGTLGYDNQYRVSSIAAGAVMSLTYPTYDANGNITTITNVLDTTKNKSFTYDTLDRLSTATSTGIWGSLGWTYDGVGNRQAEGSTVYTYYPGTNKLSGAGGTSFGYDNNGNTTSETARSYTYNQNQRMIQAVKGAMTANYTYNGNGQRVKKVVSGTTTIFHYDQRGQLIAESDGSGATAAEYVYLNIAPLAKIVGTNTYYYHNDHLATPQKMTDASGSVVWSADYKPFGEATVTVSTITNNLRFPGQYFDAETGLNYNYMRDYNPAIGRYIESDLIGIQRGNNHLYCYAKENPLKYDDPQGLYVGGIGSGFVATTPGLSCTYALFNVTDSSGKKGTLSCKSCGVGTAGMGKGKGFGISAFPLMAINCPNKNSICDLKGGGWGVGYSGGDGLAVVAGYSGGCFINGIGFGLGGASWSFEPGDCNFTTDSQCCKS